MTACAHPETNRFAWTVPDPKEGADCLCMGCTVCGEVLVGAVDLQGNLVGPQHQLQSERKETKRKGKKVKSGNP